MGREEYMLVPVPIIFEVDRKIVGLQTLSVIEILDKFCKVVNLNKDFSVSYVVDDNKIIASCMITDAGVLDCDFSRTKDLDKSPYEFYNSVKLEDGLTNADMTNFISKCVSVVFENINPEGLKVFIYDEKGNMYQFKYETETCNKPLASPYILTDKHFEVLFSLLSLGYANKSADFIEGVLNIYMIALESNIDI